MVRREVESAMAHRHDIANALRQRLLSGSHLGLIRPGERLSSVRELAHEFGVDPRVVLAAYRVLEREGLVELRQRSGIFFGTPAGAPLEQLSQGAEWAVDVLLQGFAWGTPIPDVPARLARYLETVRLRGACIECNDDQIAALCAELKSDFGFDTVGQNVDDLLRAPSTPHELRAVDLLVTTPFHAGEVQELAERAGVPWIAVSYRADVFAEIARLLPTTPVFFVITDARFAAKLGKIYASSPGADNLRVVVLEREDVADIPSGAPTYVSRTARERLAGHPLLERVVPETRMFSPASARAILTFVVRANADALRTKDGEAR